MDGRVISPSYKEAFGKGILCRPIPIILSVEVLGKAIRANNNIKGITVNNTEIKLSQYAEDTTLILNVNQDSLSTALGTVENFGNFSSLKLDDKKTEALWIGSMVGKKGKLLLEKFLNSLKIKVKVLGAWISTDPAVTLKLNYTEKVDKIRNILSCWEYRRLTLIGKIQVIKSLALSQLTYILTPLETNQNFINEINDIFYSFVWNNKNDKIKRTVLIDKYENGGLKIG